MVPYRIHLQNRSDECTACALSAIAESYLGRPVDDEFIYNNTKDGKYGVTPERAIASVISNGIRLLDSGKVISFFDGSRKIRGLNFLWFPDFFNAIKNALSFGPVFCGTYWQTGWDKNSLGILVHPPVWQKYAPHAFAVIGVTTIDGTEYLIIQNSRGSDVGDGGLFYASQQIANMFTFAYQVTTSLSAPSASDLSDVGMGTKA